MRTLSSQLEFYERRQDGSLHGGPFVSHLRFYHKGLRNTPSGTRETAFFLTVKKNAKLNLL